MDLPHEEFWCLYLNRSNKILDKVKISQGGISGTVIDIRLVVKEGLERLASGIILCHNHPSGNREPSDADKIITKKIKHILFCRIFFLTFVRIKVDDENHSIFLIIESKYILFEKLN